MNESNAKASLSCPLLPSEWKTPDVFRRRLGENPGRQRMMAADGHLLLILHSPPKDDHSLREGRFLWRDPSGAWSPKGMTHGQLAVGELLTEYEQAVERLRQAELLALSPQEYFQLLTELNPLARSARNLHRVLQEAREAMPEDRSLILLRDRAYALSRAAELLLADAKAALDFATARRAEEQAETSHRMAVSAHRLNVLVACFFPIATLTAVFSMSLGHGLDEWDAAAAPLPMLCVLGVGFLLGLALTAFVTRPAKPRRARARRGPKNIR